MYEFTSRVRYSEIGRNRNMSIPALFARLQDCCVFHAESIGCGPFAWEKEQRGFIIVSWQVVLHRMPVFPETITEEVKQVCAAKRERRMRVVCNR